MRGKYVQYGCGLCAPPEWENYDSSPTLRLQKFPIIGKLIKEKLNVKFPDNVIYGDITKGLPVPDNSCDGVYSSHTLEHLSLKDFRIAIKNTFKILKPEGIFRCVIPDLEAAARLYISKIENDNSYASVDFMHQTLLGKESRDKGIKSIISAVFGNSHHLWMWDRHSLKEELIKAGFRSVREYSFNDSEDKMFFLVESKDRFENSVAMEARK